MVTVFDLGLFFELVSAWARLGTDRGRPRAMPGCSRERLRRTDYVDGSPSLSKKARLRSVAEFTSLSKDMTSM
jgi:hypothetical protein